MERGCERTSLGFARAASNGAAARRRCLGRLSNTCLPVASGLDVAQGDDASLSSRWQQQRSEVNGGSARFFFFRSATFPSRGSENPGSCAQPPPPLHSRSYFVCLANGFCSTLLYRAQQTRCFCDWAWLVCTVRSPGGRRKREGSPN
jgi:hypothetical protein